MKAGRIQRCLAALEKKRLDGLLVTAAANRRYLSGFSGSSGILLITRKAKVLATDFRYYSQVEREAPDWQLFEANCELVDWFAGFIGRAGPARLGFESKDVTVDTYKSMRRALRKAGTNTRMVAADGLVEKLRMVKDKDETDKIRRAVAISRAAAERFAEIVVPGISEIEAAWKIEQLMRSAGSEPITFPVICASGPNSALPHAQPTERIIQAGEPVVIDFGARVEGYTADLTRTLCPGRRDGRFEEIYAVVQAAQAAAIRGVKHGMMARRADRLARDVIVEAGYGERFGHALGHGIGLEIHEGPFVGKQSRHRLENGMVFTVEPGIYVPGWGGIRLEDDVVLEGGKAKILSA